MILENGKTYVGSIICNFSSWRCSNSATFFVSWYIVDNKKCLVVRMIIHLLTARKMSETFRLLYVCSVEGISFFL